MTEISKMVNEAAEKYTDENCAKIYGSRMGGREVISAFKSGAKWKSEQDKAKLQELSKLVKTYREALEHYADISTYTLTEGHELRTILRDDLQMADEPTPWGAKATYIGGRRAREALSTILPSWLTMEERKE